MKRQRAADLSMFAAEKRKVVRRGTLAARGRQTLAEAALAVNSSTTAADWDLRWMAVRWDQTRRGQNLINSVCAGFLCQVWPKVGKSGGKVF